ncbi:helix-turn-helix transcriptional regulator [Mycolicibacterium septicum]|uniref:helix-turn-helix transcriptional regulator n=1 Tax=Mycolicibacterium septicum TaxID=98668 RepID=UPI001AF5A935|nr:AraC family transcriptional regulator [Mycolicibacterium septicum]QRY53268.1 helix-turn-helix transcriptional regulator [Mycolicibacterium septicum]
MKPWDDDRPPTRRIVLGERLVAIGGMSLRFATEQIHSTTEWRCLDEDRHQLFLHRAGKVRSMETDLDWGPSGRVLPKVGDIWVVPAGDKCAALVEGDTVDTCGIAIPDHLLDAPTLVPRIKHRNPLIHQLVERLFAVSDRDDAAARLLIDSVGETLRLVIARTCAENPPPPAGRRPDTLDAKTRSKVIEFLEDSIDSTITLETLARQANMPVAVFITAFRAAFHTTPYQYLLDLRFERAKSLLRHTSSTIAEISVMVGFSRPSHFSAAFRRRVGVSPRVYRERR